MGFDFKRDRFVDVHRKAIQYPRSKFSYIGIDPPNLDENVKEQEVKTMPDLIFDLGSYIVLWNQ